MAMHCMQSVPVQTPYTLNAKVSVDSLLASTYVRSKLGIVPESGGDDRPGKAGLQGSYPHIRVAFSHVLPKERVGNLNVQKELGLKTSQVIRQLIRTPPRCISSEFS